MFFNFESIFPGLEGMPNCYIRTDSLGHFKGIRQRLWQILHTPPGLLIPALLSTYTVWVLAWPAQFDQKLLFLVWPQDQSKFSDTVHPCLGLIQMLRAKTPRYYYCACGTAVGLFRS